MKSLRFVLIAATVLFMACNNQPRPDKNMKDDDLLLEDAKVKDEKSDTNRTNSIRVDSVKIEDGTPNM